MTGGSHDAANAELLREESIASICALGLVGHSWTRNDDGLLHIYDSRAERYGRLFRDALAPVAGLLARVPDREHDELIRQDGVHDEVWVTLHLRATDLIRLDREASVVQTASAAGCGG